MGKRELDTEEALFDSKAQKDFIKNEIGDLSSARITQCCHRPNCGLG